MNWVAVGIAALVAFSVVPTGGAAPGNEPPLADAGLDQHAEVGQTVLLDANGSRDPDGTIASYEWNIDMPNGTTMEPQDPSDPRTRFVVNEPGRYNVTIVVTDDDGAERADTLYVDVTANDGSDSEPGSSSTPGVLDTSSHREVTIIMDEYSERGTTRVRDPNHYTDSIGMGKSGIQGWMPAPNKETGSIEGVLYGRDSYSLGTANSGGKRAAVFVAYLNGSHILPEYRKGASTAKYVGYNSVSTRGPGPDSLEDYDSVDVTIKVAEGEGLLDAVGVSDYVTREDYESARGVVTTAAVGSIKTTKVVVDTTANQVSGPVSQATDLAKNTAEGVKNTFESLTTFGSSTSIGTSNSRSARVVP